MAPLQCYIVLTIKQWFTSYNDMKQLSISLICSRALSINLICLRALYVFDEILLS